MIGIVPFLKSELSLIRHSTALCCYGVLLNELGQLSDIKAVIDA